MSPRNDKPPFGGLSASGACMSNRFARISKCDVRYASNHTHQLSRFLPLPRGRIRLFAPTGSTTAGLLRGFSGLTNKSMLCAPTHNMVGGGLRARTIRNAEYERSEMTTGKGGRYVMSEQEWTWWLKCNNCGYRLPDGAAASPKCPDCRMQMNIHSDRCEFNFHGRRCERRVGHSNDHMMHFNVRESSENEMLPALGDSF